MAVDEQGMAKPSPPSDPAITRLQEENQRLKRAIDELTLLNELAREIGASLNTQEIMQTIIHRSRRAVNAEQGLITLVKPQANEPMKTLVRGMATSSAHQPFHLNQNLLGWMLRHKKPLLINDPRHDPRFQGVQWDESIRSLLCVPLMVKSELEGLLTLYNKKDEKGFTEEDQRLLAIIATQSAQVVDNARLYEEEQELRHIQEELKLAAKIQLDLLPKTAPQISGYEIAGKSLPAQSVGGDYFDFIPIDEYQLALCLGDVSGKGLPASLLMANLQATIRGQTLMCVSPGECMRRANILLYESTDIEKFATAFYAILDTRPQGPSSQHQLSYSNAGHNPPLLFPENQSPRRLETGGIMLGIMRDSVFEDEVIPFSPGDLLVIYSDGVTEAVNADDEEFGDKRLITVVRDHWGSSAEELIEKIVQAVKLYAGQTPQADDITLVVMRRV
ncbi:MAG: SpoIIE family protein phosphatase [candidate division KSB1 bacterium]|nr:SpoIIE family protein phosphatase [candidate division KSB1 bacterium]MDZ7305349.1 SpoIIE family protein phosphatase [candidate division KSB1 bacterium]MDZ7312657.1 SpoIIE family protein phosphatase [candidate division KSB1 bacterium]